MTAPLAAPHTDGAASAAFIEKRPLERYVAPAKPSLVGLSRDALAEALGAHRRAGAAAPHAGAAALALALRARRARLRRDDDAVEGAARRACAAFHAGAAGGRRRAGLRRRHAQMAAAASRRNRQTGRTRSSASTSRKPIAARCAFPARSAARSIARSATPARSAWCATSRRARSSARSCWRATGSAIGSARRRRRGDGEKRLVSNVVMMGMGEPLYNFEAVRDGLDVVADGDGLSISKRRITLSTSGVVPNIARAGDGDRQHAGGLAARGDRRAARRSWCRSTANIRCVNCSMPAAIIPAYPTRGASPSNTSCSRASTIRLPMRGRWCVWSKAFPPRSISSRSIRGRARQYECSDWEQIEKFSEMIFNAGYASPVRTPRGRDILAACGQLKSATEKLSARERLALRAMAMTD